MGTDSVAVSIIIFAYSCQSLQHGFIRIRLQGRFHGPGIFPGLWLFDSVDGHQTDEAKSEPTTKFVHLHDLGRDFGQHWDWNPWISVPEWCYKTRVRIASRSRDRPRLTCIAFQSSSLSYSSGSSRFSYCCRSSSTESLSLPSLNERFHS